MTYAREFHELSFRDFRVIRVSIWGSSRPAQPPATQQRKKFHTCEIQGRAGRAASVCKGGRTLEGTRYALVTESVLRHRGSCADPARARRRYVGGCTGLIVLFIIRLDKRFGGPGNKEESKPDPNVKERKKSRTSRKRRLRPRNLGIFGLVEFRG